MHLTQTPRRYEAKTAYGEWQAKEAGFRWDKERKVWWTTDIANAAKVAEYADQDLYERLQQHAVDLQHQAAQALEDSRATSADLDVPAPDGLEYLPFQLAGIKYAAQRDATIVGDEMGLGKTIQAIGAINADTNAKRVLVLAPASLRINWRRELEKWLVRPMTVELATGAELPASDVVVISYDALKKHHDALRALTWDIMIVRRVPLPQDAQGAAHKVHVLGGGKDEAKRVAPIKAARRGSSLTGTPIVNRPLELHPILRRIDWNQWGDWERYVTRYCAGFQNEYGWDVSGRKQLGGATRPAPL